jgi:hypothetical protein
MATAINNANQATVDQVASGDVTLLAWMETGPNNVPMALQVSVETFVAALPPSTGPMSNPSTVISALVIPIDTNSLLVGPITIASGGSITVFSGSVLRVV